MRKIRGEQIGMIFQEPQTALNPLHTIEKQIGEVLYLHQNTKRKEANARILELPLVGRQVYDLVTISGAAVQTGTATPLSRAAYPGTPTFSIAGSVNGGNTVTLDGAMHNDVASNTALPLPFPDAMQEFKIETSSPGCTP